MNMNKKRIISFLLTFTIAVGMISYAFAEENATEDNGNDPYVNMVSLTDEAETPATFMEETLSEEEQQLENGRIARKEAAKKTDRYLVKYKSESGENKVDKKLKHKVKEKKEIKGKKEKKPKKTDLIILNEPIEPERFAEELRAMNIEDSIEYIQPDFQLNPASLEVSVTEEQTTGEVSPSEETESGTEGEDSPGLSNDGASVSEEEEADQNTENQPPESSDGEQTSNEPATEETSEPTTEETENIDQPEKQPEEKSEEELTEEIENVSQTSPVIVSVIDTGADVSHDQIKDYLWTNEDHINGWNFVQENADVYNAENPLAYAHGTHISGIIAQVANNQGVPLQLITCKVFENGTAYTSDVIEAIEFSVEKGARIINMSFGGAHFNPALLEAIQSSDALFVTAAGNNRMSLDETPVYPACFDLPNIINVSSTNADGGFSYFSNYSTTQVDVTARGRDVVSAIPGNQSGAYTGTSMSAAYVSGVAMAISANHVDWDISQIKTHILDTADRFSNLVDKVQNGRCVNLQNALSNTFITGVSTISPADDFDVSSYDPTPSERLELFSLKKAVQVSIGHQHTLILMEDGTVWSFGNGNDGQLGNGVNGIVTSAAPVQVIGLHDVVKVEAGYHFSYAIKRDGTLWGWGGNGGAQLGTGSLQSTNIPVQIIGLQNIIDVSAGTNHSQALDTAGNVYGWGSSVYGELGYHPMDQTLPLIYTSPELMYQDADITSVGVGYAYSAAFKRIPDGVLLMRGDNTYGQLKDGTYGGSDIFHENSSLWLDKVAYGERHVIAKDIVLGVKVWGSNASGQLGLPLTTEKLATPETADIPFLPQDIAAGAEHSLVLCEDGTVMGSGSSSKGQLLSSGTLSSFTELTGINEVAKISAAFDNSAVIKNDGTVWIWGSNENKQILNNTTASYTTPVQVGNVHNMDNPENSYYLKWPYRFTGELQNKNGGIKDEFTIEITEAGIYSVAVDKEDATIDCAEIEGSGNLIRSFSESNGKKLYQFEAGTYRLTVTGQTTGAYSLKATRAAHIGRVEQISEGYNHVLLLGEDGHVWQWGDNVFMSGAEMTATVDLLPDRVIGLSNITSVTRGYYTSYAVKSDGTVYWWGNNNFYKLGNIEQKSSYPIVLSSISNVETVADLQKSVLFLKKDGTVWAMGTDSAAFMSTSTEQYQQPTQLAGVTNVTKLCANANACYALKSDGTVWSWGVKQLGRSTDNDNWIPKQVSGLSNITDIDCGTNHCIALKTDGTVWTWGDSRVGYTATGAGNSTLPVCVSGINNAMQIATGDSFNLVLTPQGTYGWGYNPEGHIVNIESEFIQTPTKLTQVSGIAKVFSSEFCTHVADDDGVLWSFGSNRFGQLGNQQTTASRIPIAMPEQFTNDTAERAENININLPTAGWINDAEDVRYYECTPSGAYNLQFYADNVNVEIRNKTTDAILTTANNVQNQTISCSFDGTSTYVIKVSGSSEQLFSFVATSSEGDPSQIDLHKNVSYDVLVTASNVSNFENLVYTVTYPVGDFSVITLCAQAQNPVTGIGAVEGADVHILNVQEGRIQFKVTKIQPGAFTGVVNTIRLRGLREGVSAVQVHVD